MKKSQKKQAQKKGQWGGRRENQTGRPKNDPSGKAVTVSLSMSPTLHRQLSEKATSRDMTVNDAIREAIRAWVDR
jgi:predicted HicB family RNase H-like nuclease